MANIEKTKRYLLEETKMSLILFFIVLLALVVVFGIDINQKRSIS
jgi:hypothetical protein